MNKKVILNQTQSATVGKQREQKRTILEKLICIGLLACICGYVFVLCKIVLFKYGFASGMRSVNLMPFGFLTSLSEGMSLGVVLKNVLGNVALFIPMGAVFACFLKPEDAPASTNKGKISRKWLAVPICAMISVAFELIQFATSSGATDIDDVILNTAGGLLGAALYIGVLKRIDKKAGIPFGLFLFLLIFGIAGVVSLYLFEPSMLPAQVEYVNEEVVEGLDLDAFDVETVCVSIDGQTLTTTTEPDRIYQPDTSQTALPKDGVYPLAEDVVLIAKAYTYQYSPNGNIQKTTVTYQRITADELNAACKEKQTNIDITLNKAGQCSIIVINSW